MAKATENARTYEATITYTSRELTKYERVKFKDASFCIRLDEATKEGDILIDYDFHLVLDVHNEKAKDNKDYTQYIIVGKDGQAYLTGSKNIYNSLMDIVDEMEGEDFSIIVTRVPSKNYKGKEFLSCHLA